MPAFYEPRLWKPQKFLLRNPDFHHRLLGRWDDKFLEIKNGETGQVLRRYAARDGDCVPLIQKLQEAARKTYLRYLSEK